MAPSNRDNFCPLNFNEEELKKIKLLYSWEEIAKELAQANLEAAKASQDHLTNLDIKEQKMSRAITKLKAEPVYRFLLAPKSEKLLIADYAIQLDMKALVDAINDIEQSIIEIESIQNKKVTIKLHNHVFNDEEKRRELLENIIPHIMKQLGLFTLYQIIYPVTKDQKYQEKESIPTLRLKKLPKEVTTLLRPEEIKKFLPEKLLEIALRRAAASKDAAYLAKFIDMVTNLDATDDTPGKKRTALHQAILHEKVDNFKLLTDWGAQWHIIDDTQKSPYDLLNKAKNATLSSIPLRYKNKIRIGSADKNQISSSFVIKIVCALEQIRQDKLKANKMDLLFSNNVAIEIQTTKSSRHGEFTFPDLENPKNTKIIIYANQFKEYDNYHLKVVISHEIEHAFKYWVHLLKNEKSPAKHDPRFFLKGSFGLPFFPFVVEEKQKFNQLLSEGDKNLIRKIHSLYNKLHQSLVLTADEQKQYEQISDVLTRYKPRVSHYDIPPEFSLELKASPELKEQINSGNIIVRIIAKDDNRAPFFVRKITDCNNAKGFHAFSLLDPVERGLCLTYETLTRICMREHAYDYDLTCEHHARTVGELPSEIIDFFYPELSLYDKCDTDFLAGEYNGLLSKTVSF